MTPSTKRLVEERAKTIKEITNRYSGRHESWIKDWDKCIESTRARYRVIARQVLVWELQSNISILNSVYYKDGNKVNKIIEGLEAQLLELKGAE